MVLHALRDHLTVDQAAGLASPAADDDSRLLLRRLASCRQASQEPQAGRLHVAVASQLPGLDFDPEQVVRAVLQVIAKHVTLGEIDHLCHSLPHELRDLWTEELNTVWF